MQTKTFCRHIYYKVRAYKTVNGKTIYSNFSRYSGTTVKVLNLMKNLPPLSPSYVGKYSTIINKIGGMHKKKQFWLSIFLCCRKQDDHWCKL